MTVPEDFGSWYKLKKLITGKDGHTRGAVIRVPTNNGQTTLLQRLLQLLYPMEMIRKPTSAATTVVEPERGVDTNTEPLSEGTTVEDTPVRRSRRSAATQASDHLLPRTRF